MRTNQAARVSVVVTALVFAAAAALAGTVNYGDFDDIVNGGTVVYTDVTEMSVTHADPLYGAPEVSVNTLDFDPMGFGATASGGTADALDGRLEFGVNALAGHYIPEVTISEMGDFTLIGQGTANTFVAADTPVKVQVNAVDGVTLGSPIVFEDDMSFVPPDGVYNLIDDGGAGVPWVGSVAFDLNQLLVDEGISFNLGATSIDIKLNNVLAAASEPGSVAAINKKDFQAFSISIVPEPSTIGLVLLGLVAAVHARRRR